MGWHWFISLVLAGLTFVGCQHAGAPTGWCFGLAALVFVLYWFGWVAYFGDGSPGDWF